MKKMYICGMELKEMINNKMGTHSWEHIYLLFQDLSARLMFGVIGQVPVTCVDPTDIDMNGFYLDHEVQVNAHLIAIDSSGNIQIEGLDEDSYEAIYYEQEAEPYWIESFKPYLYPISSMTEEQGKEFLDFIGLDSDLDSVEMSLGYIAIIEKGTIEFDQFSKAQYWLYKNMFDFNHLIDKGLAIEITEENNPYVKYSNKDTSLL